MKKPAIDRVQNADPQHNRAHDAIKETLDQITGRKTGIKKISQLDSTASLADVISTVNKILERLQ